MKKRLISLLVALCMAVTLLPVSAITAWAEEGGQLKIVQGGYPNGSNSGNTSCSGNGWSYNHTNKTLTLNPSTPTSYDFSNNGIHTGPGNNTDCKLIIGQHATVTDGYFHGVITNHGTIIGGKFYSSVTNEPNGIIENGQFGNCTVTNNDGTINGGTFKETSSIIGTGFVASGYTLTATMPAGFDSVSVNGYGNSCYVIPNQASVSVDISYRFEDMYGRQNLPPLDVIDNAQHMLLSDWCGGDLKIEFDRIVGGAYKVTFTAPPAKGSTVTISPLTRLVIDKDGYPVGTEGGTQGYSGNGWSYNHTDKTLTLNPSTPTSYDFSGEGNALNPAVQLEVKSGAKLTGGAFAKMPTGEGAGTFKTVTLNGTDPITAVNGLASGDWGNTLYAVSFDNVTIASNIDLRDINRHMMDDDSPLYPNITDKTTIHLNTEYLLTRNYISDEGDIILNQASYDLPLIMASNGTPVIDNTPYKSGGGHYTYYGDGWHCQKATDSVGTLYLENGTYDFRSTDPVNKNGEPLNAVICSIVNEGGTIEDGTFSKPIVNGQPGSTSSMTPKIKGGTFAAGLYCNNGEITGGAFNGKDSILPIGIGLSGNYRSVTVNGGAIVKVNDTFPLVPGETVYDLVQGSAWNLYSYAGTVLTVKADVDITNINGQEIGNAFSSIYPNGETNKKVVRFEMPDSDVVLNAPQIIVPDPKPEPTPDPTPETYTLTVKGGTFTYNGSEAMTSANVPVDAEVKVTLNQSAVPEGMVFDLWAMDEASLLGNPAVAYNEESFTIPAGSVAKGSIVTVEAQYRDATIESEPSILGTAAIIGVAGAGTAVIVWQGYRIGMELYEKYFQPTPEETAAEQPAPEAPAAAAS